VVVVGLGLPLIGGGMLAQQIIIRLTDDKGNVREIPVKPGVKIEIVEPPIVRQEINGQRGS